MALLSPCVLSAQSTLTFARVLDVTDLPVTGFAIVNPGTSPANVTFSLRSVDGRVVSSSIQLVPAGGQLARLGSELFPTTSAGGWVQAVSASANLRGFWLGGDFLTYTDGAEAMASASEFVLPVVAPQSEIHVVNTTNTDQVILVRLMAAEGNEVTDPEVRFLPAGGSFHARSGSMFTASDLVNATHARLTCGTCAAAIVIQDFLAAPSRAVANGTNTTSTVRELDFPHVIHGTLNGLTYTTLVSVTNLSAVEQTLRITFTPETGTQSVTVARDVAPNGTLRDSPEGLFGTSSGFRNGWIRVIAEQPVTGVVIYAEQVNRGVALTPGLPRSATAMFLGHIAELSPWWTGVALLNPGTVPAVIDIYALAPDGGLIGHAQFSLNGGSKVARLLNEWIPQTATRSNDGGFVFVKATEPIYGLELFFRRDLRVLSNVPPFLLAPGETFTPPPTLPPPL